MALIMDIAPPTKASPSRRRFSRRNLIIGGGVVVILVAVGLGAFFRYGRASSSPVPAQVRKAVTFPIYYPEQQKLPAGYTLDMASFHLAQPGVVIYSVMNQGGQRLLFSEEQKPDSSVIDKFTSSYIPLHTGLKTSLGEAQLGAYGTGKNLRTVISLPINRGPWLILTAPPASSHDDLLQVIRSLVK